MSQLLLNLENLHERHEVTIDNRRKVFDDILKSCHRKIRKFNNEFKRQECLYEPPAFIMGRPPYNYVDLVNYLLTSLTQNGLKAEWLAAKKSIYVSWKVQDVNMDQYREHLSEGIPTEDEDHRLKITTIRSRVEPPKAKKKDPPKPKIQHMAMIEYDNHAKDMIPINIKHINMDQ